MQERLKALVRHPLLLKAVIALLFGIAVIVGLMILQLFVGGQNQQQAAKKAGIVSVPLDGITPTEAGVRLDSLQVNGTLRIGDSIVLTPSSRPDSPTAGQQYYDLNDQTLYYWNGASWVAVGQQNLDPILGLIASLQAKDAQLDTKDAQLDQVDADTAARINQLQAAIDALQSNQPTGDFVELQADTPGTQQTGNINVSGSVIAGNFQGSGVGLTALNATNVTAGTLNDARLSGNVTLQGNTFNGANQLLQLNGSGQVNDAQLSSNVALENAANTFTQTNTFSQGIISTRNGAPAGGNASLNGLIFYDTVTSKFYAYENGAAKELCNKADLGCGNDGASVSLQTAYNNGNTIVATDARDIKFTLSNTATDSNFILDIIDAGQFKIQDNGTDRVTINRAGDVVATSFAGNGSNLTALNATNVSSGTLADARLSSNVTLQGNIFNAANRLLQLNGSGQVNDALLSVNVAFLNGTQTFTGANTFSNASNSFTGSGAGLTSLNASNISSGTLSDSRLSSNVALKGGNNTFTGTNRFDAKTGFGQAPSATGAQIQVAGGIQSAGTTSGNNADLAGTLVYDTADGKFKVYEGASGTLKTLCNSIDGCATAGGAVTLQGAYDNSASPALITTTAVGKTVGIKAGAGFNSTTLFNVQDASGGSVLAVDTVNNKVVVTNIEGNGAGLTNLNASNIATGTLSDSRLSSNVTLQGNTFNGAGQLVQLDGTSRLPAVSGALLTNLNAGALATGTVNDARLSTNVALENISNTFSADQRFDGKVSVGQAASANGAAVQVAGGVQTAGTTSGNNANLAGTIVYDTADGKYKIYEGASGVLKTLCNQTDGNCGGAGGGASLQSAYNTGNTITTTDARDISFTLADTATDSNFLVNIASGSTGKVAFQTGGQDKLTVNASNVVIGAGTSNTLLVLDNIANASLPTGVNGALVYDSTANKFLMYENGAYKQICNMTDGNCGGAGGGATLQTAYEAGNTINATAGEGNLAVTLNDADFLLTIPSGSSGSFRLNNGASDTFTIDRDGDVVGASFAGFGTNLTNLNASNIASGTLADARLTSNVALLDRNSQTFTGNTVLFRNNSDSTTAFRVQNAAGTQTPLTVDTTNNKVIVSNIEGSGAGLTSLNASNVSSGTLADARLSSNVTLQGNTFNGANQLVKLDGSGNQSISGSVTASGFSGSGANLTALNASNISSGTLADARLSSNVALRNQDNAFSTSQTVTGTVSATSFTANGNAGSTITCSGGQYLQNATSVGGIVTGGTCATPAGATSTLQDVYNNDTAGQPADIVTTSASKTLLFKAGGTFDSTALFDVQNAAGTSQLKVDTTNSKVVMVNGEFTGDVTVGDDLTVTGDVVAATFSGDGSGITALNASNVSTGTLNDGRLSSNVALKNINNSFSAAQSITVNGGKTTLALTSTGTDTGITIGGDTNLYRGGAGRLRTDTKLEVGTSLGIGVFDPSNARIALGGSGSSNGIVFGAGEAGSANLYKDGLSSALLKTDSSFQIDTRLGLGTDPTAGTARLQFANSTTADGGIQFGSDTNLYRTSANNLKTDDTFDAAAYKVGGTAGSSVTCTSGDVLTNQVVTGGIVTGGTCSAAANTTLQGAYNNDASGRADIVTTSAAKTVLIQAGSGFNSASLFEVQNATGNTVFVADSTNSRIAIGKATASYTVDANGDINVASGVYRVAGAAGTSFGGTCGSGNVITNVNVSGGIVTGVTCAANSNTMQQTYTASTGGTTPEVKLDTTRGALNIQDADTSIGTNTSLLTVSNSNASGIGTTLLDVKNSGNVTINGANGPVTGSWASTTSQTTNRRHDDGGSFYANGYWFAVGGYDNNSGVNGFVDSAKINADGTLGSWTATTSLPVNRYGFDAVYSNGYVYVTAGHDGTTTQTTTYYARVNNNGTLGSWNTTSALPAGRYEGSGFAYNGYVYHVGGANSSDTAQSTVYFARQNPDGTLGGWSTTSSLAVAKWRGNVAVANGYVYFLGGARTTTVQYAKINSDGTLGTWATTNSLTDDRGEAAVYVQNGYLYLWAGEESDQGDGVTTGMYAQLNANGTTGTWSSLSALPALPANRQRGIYTVVNGYAYWSGGRYQGTATYESYYTAFPRTLLGGALDLVGLGGENLAEGGSGGNLTAGDTRVIGSLDVSGQASFNSNASVSNDLAVGNSAAFGVGQQTSPWSSTTTLPSDKGAALATSVVHNGYVYSIGGYNDASGNRSAVSYARLNADGSTPTAGTGAWADTTALPQVRTMHSSVVANGYLYVIGGSNGITGSSQTTTYVAKINYDGTLGSWSTTSALPAARMGHQTIFSKGYIYAISGASSIANVDDGASGQTNVYAAKVNPDGTLGAWNSTTSLPQARNFASAVTANGYVYVVGGRTTGNVTSNTVYYAKINDGTLGTWSTTNTLSDGRYQASAVVLNGRIYSIGGTSASSSTASAGVQYADLNADGTVGSWTTASESLPGALRFQQSTTANGHILTIGGWMSNGFASSAMYKTSGPRVSLAGSLDLVGVVGENLAEGGSGGTLTAGNTSVIGDLSVSGQANIEGGASVGGALTVNGSAFFQNPADSTSALKVSNAAGTTTVFDVDTTNARVGIGTATPSTALGIAGTGTANGITFGNGAANDVLLYRSANNTLSTGTGDSFNVDSNLQTGGTTRISSTGALSNVSFGSAVGALVTNSSGTISSASGATTGQCLMSNGSGTAPSFQTCPAGSSGWELDGNTVGGTDFLGSTNDADLVFKTSDVERLRIYHQNNGGSILATIRSGQGGKTFLRTDSQDIITVDTSTPKLQLYLRGSVGGTQVCTSGGGNAVQDIGTCSSSAAYKDDIIPFEQGDYRAVLQKISDTNIYNYKHKTDRPGTQRYGLISENMPSELTYLDPNGYPTPDWFSVYGYMWAGIRALNEKIDQGGAVQGTEIKLTGAESTEAGDLVTLHATDAQTLIKTTKAYDPGVTGIAKGGSSSTEQGVATSGIVDVKVTNQNGAIVVGDYLAASDTPGHAMKTTQAGMAIGRAVAPFDGTTGTVKVLLNVGYYNPSNLAQSTSALSATEASQFADFTTQTLVVTGSAQVASITVEGNADVKGTLTVGKGLQVSDSVSLDANNRGIDVIVEEGLDEFVVRFNKPQENNQYSIQVEPNWLTDTAVVEKTNEGFTVKFEKAAPDKAKLDWLLIR